MSSFDVNLNQLSPGSIMSGFIEDSLERAFMKVEKGVERETECQTQGILSNADDLDAVQYLNREVFPTLLPCLEQMLFAAKENNVLKVQKSRFGGLDYLAELLWNRNPHHPERQSTPHVSVFDIPFVKAYLENKPRPVYPKSWLWSPEEAAVVIQAAVRGHLVRRAPAVQELRQFWRALAEERCLEPKDQS